MAPQFSHSTPSQACSLLKKLCHPGTYGFSGKLHAFHLAVVEKFNRFRTLDRLLHFPKKRGGSSGNVWNKRISTILDAK